MPNLKPASLTPSEAASLPPTHVYKKLLARQKVLVRSPASVVDLITPTYKGVDGLCPCVRSRVQQLMRACSDAGAPLTLIETLRGADRQDHYWRIKATRTLDSLHEPQRPEGLALAADLCPTEYLPMKGWNSRGLFWSLLGKLAGDLGLTWGGSWAGFKDLCHVQLERCLCQK